MSYYVYRFFNKENEVIYVGRTQCIKKRMQQHFNPKKVEHSRRNKEVVKIDYFNFDSKAHSYMYEIQMIDYYKPKYNKDYLTEQVSDVLLKFEHFNFEIFDQAELKSLKNKKKRQVKSEKISKSYRENMDYYIYNYGFSEKEALIITRILEINFGQGFDFHIIASVEYGISIGEVSELVSKLEENNHAVYLKHEKDLSHYDCYCLSEDFVNPNFTF